MKRLWPILLLLFSVACSDVRLSMRKGWVAERDEAPRAERVTLPRARPHLAPLHRSLRDSVGPLTSTPTSLVDRPAPPLPGLRKMHERIAAERPSGPLQESAGPEAAEHPDDPERRPWNWLAPGSSALFIAGMAWAISLQSTELLILVGAVCFALAYFAAKRCRDKGMSGQGFALVTMYLAGVTFLVGMLAFLSRFR